MTAKELLEAYAKGERDFTGAYLAGAYLAHAYLAGANLTDANLAGAYLARAKLGAQWIVQGPTRSDGYWFSLQKLTGESEPMLRAGCRYFTLAEARKHWNETRGGTPLGNETFAILDCMEALAKARSLL